MGAACQRCPAGPGLGRGGRRTGANYTPHFRGVKVLSGVTTPVRPLPVTSQETPRFRPAHPSLSHGVLDRRLQSLPPEPTSFRETSWRNTGRGRGLLSRARVIAHSTRLCSRGRARPSLVPAPRVSIFPATLTQQDSQ